MTLPDEGIEYEELNLKIPKIATDGQGGKLRYKWVVAEGTDEDALLEACDGIIRLDSGCSRAREGCSRCFRVLWAKNMVVPYLVLVIFV